MWRYYCVEVPSSYLGQATCLPWYEILRSCRLIPCHVQATTASFHTALILLLIAIGMTLCEEILTASLNKEHVLFTRLYSSCKLVNCNILAIRLQLHVFSAEVRIKWALFVCFCTCNRRKAWGTRWLIWFSHCSTSRKVAVSIPDCVIGIFHCHNTTGSTMSLGSNQPLSEMSTRNISR